MFNKKHTALALGAALAITASTGAVASAQDKGMMCVIVPPVENPFFGAMQQHGVEVDLAGGNLRVALGLAELEVLEDGLVALRAVRRDVDLGRVGAEVDDADLGALCARLHALVIDHDRGDLGQLVRGRDRGQGATVELEVDRADDGAVGWVRTSGHDLDGVGAGRHEQVVRKGAEGHILEDGGDALITHITRFIGIREESEHGHASGTNLEHG